MELILSHVLSCLAHVRCEIFSTSAFANSIALEAIFSLRGPVGVGNDEMGLQYFKIDISIEKF